MAFVGGSQAYVGLTMSEESTWGTASAGTYIRVPLLSEDLRLVRATLPKSREIGESGALEVVDTGRELVRGTIRVRPRYDGDYFHMLLAHFFGDETVCPDEWVDGFSMTDADSINTHGYAPATSVPDGLTFRRYLSGATSGGHYDVITGGIITGMTIEASAEEVMVASFDVLAQDMTPTSGASALPTATGDYLVKVADFDRSTGGNDASAETTAGSVFRFALDDYTDIQTATQKPVSNFRLSLSRNVDAVAALLTEIQMGTPPTKNDTNDMEIEVTTFLEDIVPTVGNDMWHPFYQFINNLHGALNIIAISDTEADATDSLNRALRFHFPKIKWTDVPPVISGGGQLPYTMRGLALSGSVVDAPTGVDVAASAVSAVGDPGDVRCFVAVDNGDDSGTAYSGV